MGPICIVHIESLGKDARRGEGESSTLGSENGQGPNNPDKGPTDRACIFILIGYCDIVISCTDVPCPLLYQTFKDLLS